MLDLRTLGEISGKPHTVHTSAKTGERLSEFVFTRDGFSSGFSILYLNSAPTAIKAYGSVKADLATIVGDSVPLQELPLMRRHMQTWDARSGRDLLTSRTALFRNQSTRVSVVRGKATFDGAFCNGDGDEMYFVYEGSGTLLTPFGKLPFRKSDYVIIPRGTPYIFEHSGSVEMLLVEGDPVMEIPQEFRNPYGQLRLEAPYTHRDFRSPCELLTSKDADQFLRMVTLKNGRLDEHTYQTSPAAVVGWDGSVYPIAFSIHDYLPKTGKIHLPPNLHMTFRGPKVVVCSFVPRLVDYGEGAIPCPYPHANVHCDEILYYVSGNFTSRRGISERSISFHPAGVAHGPQPGAYFKSIGHKETNELAVMVDTWEPLHCTRAALGIEDPKYPLSWQD